jgi:outer membrane receptor protein involved in Fe transport
MTVAPSTTGARSVAEAYGELLIPILADLPLIEHLEADLSYRYSDYENAKGVSSYNVSLNWRPFHFLTVRGGYSRAIRAPTLEDLFASAVPVSLNLGQPSATSTGGDPCDVRSSFRQGTNATQIRQLCIAMGVPAGAVDSYTLDRQTLFGTASGNPNLGNEKADTVTAGMILQSPFSSPALSHLRFSVDYFDIKIKDAIGQIPLNSAFSRCFNLDAERSNPNYDAANENCSFFPRDPQTGLIREIQSRTLNLGQYHVRGIDLQLDYQLPLSTLGLDGTFGLNFVGSYLDKYEIQTLPGLPLLNYAGYGGRPTIRPHWKTLTTVSYDLGPFETILRWRFAQGIKDISRVSNPDSTTPGAPDYHYFDLSLGWDFDEDTGIRLIVSNLFDAEPYALGGSPGETDQTTYDVIGRNFTISLRKKF